MTTEVLGRQVTGEIVRSGKAEVEQWPGTAFLDRLDAILALPDVESVRWTQYTPYFNDGEPCIFGINDAYVKLVGNEPLGDDDDDEGFIEDGSMLDYDRGDYGNRPAKPEFATLYPVFKALADNMSHFEDFLRESFGDHARVTATTAGFAVEFYEHD